MASPQPKRQCIGPVHDVPTPPEPPVFFQGMFMTRKELAIAAKIQLALPEKLWDIWLHFARKNDPTTQAIVSLRTDPHRPRFTIMHPADYPENCVTDIKSDSEFLCVPKYANALQLHNADFEDFVSDFHFKKIWPHHVATLRRLRERQSHYFDYKEATEHIKAQKAGVLVYDKSTYAAMRTQSEWLKKLFPPSPHKYYKDKGYETFEKFCGLPRILPYAEACKVVRDHKIQTKAEYTLRYKELNPRLPSKPSSAYNSKNVYTHNGWKGWDMFLHSDIF